jgi:hypothetical protein
MPNNSLPQNRAKNRDGYSAVTASIDSSLHYQNNPARNRGEVAGRIICVLLLRPIKSFFSRP